MKPMNEEMTARIKQLEENSILLGIMGMHLEDFADDPEESVLTTLLRLITDYRYLQYEQAQKDLDKSIQKDNDNNDLI